MIDSAWATADAMAALEPGAVGAAKTALTLGSDLSLADAIALETRLAASLL